MMLRLALMLATTAVLTSKAQLHGVPERQAAKLRRVQEQCGNDLLVVFVHVPKTGGSSVRDLLQKCAGKRGKQIAYGHQDHFLAMNATSQQKVMAIQAHMGYGIHSQHHFPQHRKRCTHYITIVDTLPSIMWSAYKFHNDERQKSGRDLLSPIEFLKIRRPLHCRKHACGATNPWSFNGSVTWQYCCWHDAQHIPQAEERKPLPFEEDPTCPRDPAERLACAGRRLCNDFTVVESKATLSSMFQQIGILMGCEELVEAHHHSNPSNNGAYHVGREELSLISAMVTEGGASDDATIGWFGSTLVASADRQEKCRGMV